MLFASLTFGNSLQEAEEIAIKHMWDYAENDSRSSYYFDDEFYIVNTSSNINSFVLYGDAVYCVDDGRDDCLYYKHLNFVVTISKKTFSIIHSKFKHRDDTEYSTLFLQKK